MIDKKLEDVFFRIFNVKVKESDDINTIPNWDSLRHLKLILEIEEIYKIKFNSEEIPKLISVKLIQESINKARGSENENSVSKKE